MNTYLIGYGYIKVKSNGDIAHKRGNGDIQVKDMQRICLQYPDIHGYYISVYYAEKLEREQGTDTALDTNGYATLTGFYTTEAMVQTMEPWEVAAALQPYYTMNQYSRILVNGIEY